MATWTVVSGYSRSVTSTQSLTEVGPPAGAQDGALLSSVRAVVATLTAPNGQTFTGAGSLLAYRYSKVLSRWIRAPEADLSMGSLTGLSEGSLSAVPVVYQDGYFAWLASSVGVSGGAQFTLVIECSAIIGGGAI